MAQNTYGDISNPTAGWFSHQLLMHSKPQTVLERFAQSYTLPKHETKVMQWRRPVSFPLALTPLTEGRTPVGNKFRYEDVAVQIRQYGDWTGITDHVNDFNKNNVLGDIVMMQGEQIAATRERLTWNTVTNGLNVHYPDAVTSRSAIVKANTLTAGLTAKVTTDLMGRKAMMIGRVMAGSEKYDTYPVESTYMVVAHSDLRPTLRSLKNSSVSNSQFVPTSKYGSGMAVTSTYEVGSFEEMRFICPADHVSFKAAGATISSATDKAAWRWSENAAGDDKYDVYPLVVLGRHAFACVALAGAKAVRPVVINADKPEKSDPLGQRGMAGWKSYFACQIMNDSWMSRIEVAVGRSY